MSEQDEVQDRPADGQAADAPADTVPPQAAEPAEPVAPDAAVTSPGAMLREAREAAGLSLDMMSSQVRLNLMTLMAMESDDFVTLSEPVYVRGYYRKCAQVLGLPVDEVVAAYERIARPRAPALPAKLPLVPGGEIAAGGSGLLRWLAVAVVLLTLAAAAGWWLLRETGTTTVSPVTLPATSVAPRVDGDGDTTLPAAAAPAAPDAGLAAAPDDAGVAADEAAADPVLPEPVAATVADAPGQLRLELVEASWVRVTDADQRNLVNGLHDAGRVFELTGTPPLQVRLGNAPGVRLRYQGRDIDLGDHTGRNRTALLQLP